MKINYQSDFKIVEKSLNGDVNTPFRFTYFNPFKGKFIASFDGHEYVGCSRMEDGSLLVAFDRSEERRVGKECRSRWSPYH